MNEFRRKYGPWALIAGASEGIGAAFAEEIAARGVGLVLAARREAVLEATAGAIRSRYGVDVQTVVADLGTPDGVAAVQATIEAIDVGLLVYNAALALQGPFLRETPEALDRAIAVNCSAPVRLVRACAQKMSGRGRGGIVLMSSLAGLQGSPYVGIYSATKAFGAALAEALWYELADRGVDVLACIAGATATPGYRASLPDGAGLPSTVMDPTRVAAGALRALGRRPTYIPGIFNKTGALVMRRVLSIRAAVSIMGRATAAFAGDDRRRGGIRSRR